VTAVLRHLSIDQPSPAAIALPGRRPVVVHRRASQRTGRPVPAGPFPRSTHRVAAGLAAAEQLNEPVDEAGAHQLLGAVLAELGEDREALRHLAHAEALGDPAGLADTLGWFWSLQGNHRRALTQLIVGRSPRTAGIPCRGLPAMDASGPASSVLPAPQDHRKGRRAGRRGTVNVAGSMRKERSWTVNGMARGCWNVPRVAWNPPGGKSSEDFSNDLGGVPSSRAQRCGYSGCRRRGSGCGW
jgi:hypothetical protein